MSLKSAPEIEGSGNGSQGSQGSQAAHLVSDTATWQLRQVSTSNSIYVCDTVPPAAASISTFTDDVAPQGALNAIGQRGSVLECLPVAYDVEGLIRGMLPVWRGEMEMEMETGGTLVEGGWGMGIGMRELEEGIPAPERVVREVCRRLCVLEVGGRAVVPGDEVLLEACEAGGGGLDSGGGDEELGPVQKAIYKALPREGGGGGGIERDGATAWVGELLLRCMARRGGVGVEAFLGRWRNCVPETWGGFVRVEGLREGAYELLEEGRQIRLCGEEGGEVVPKDANGKVGTEGKKRKWHEKFKEQRNQTKR